MLELTLVTCPTTSDTKWELNMTKKYTVESSTIVRTILGRPLRSSNPALKLAKTITEKIMASESGVHVERGISDDAGYD